MKLRRGLGVEEVTADQSRQRAEDGNEDEPPQSASSVRMSFATFSAVALPSSVRSVGPSASISAGTCARVTESASVPAACFATICTAFFAVKGPRY